MLIQSYYTHFSLSQVNRFAPGIKQYFSVDTNYVLNKLWIILFPYTHRVHSYLILTVSPLTSLFL